MAGEWKRWVDYNNKLDQQEKKDNGVRYVGTRHPDWPVDEKKIFPAKPIKKMADKIVDKHYQQNKNKSPFTQVAENAVKELEFKYNSTTGTFRNNEGKTLPMKEALEATEALDKNFQDHKTGDYLAKYSSHPKLEKMPLLNRNINNRKSTGVKTNPTVERYKHFKEDKKFKDDFEKEYGEQAIFLCSAVIAANFFFASSLAYSPTIRSLLDKFS